MLPLHELYDPRCRVGPPQNVVPAGHLTPPRGSATRTRIAAPVAIAGMVGGVSFWRSKHGQGPLPTRVLLLLLFAGALLVVVPAAGLLSGR